MLGFHIHHVNLLLHPLIEVRLASLVFFGRHDLAHVGVASVDHELLRGSNVERVRVDLVGEVQRTRVTEGLVARGTVTLVQVINDRLTIDSFQLGDYFNEVFAKKYPVVFVSLPSFDDWRDVTGMVTSGALWNVFGSEDPGLDKLIEQARTTTGADQDAAYQGIGQFLLDNAWYAPWAIPSVIYATADGTSATLSPGQIEPYLWDIKPTN